MMGWGISLIVFQLHENIVASNFYFVRQRSFGGGHADRIAGSQVELGAMPWADQAVADHFSVAKRTSIMRAEILNAKGLTIQHCQNHKAVIDLKGQGDVRL